MYSLYAPRQVLVLRDGVRRPFGYHPTVRPEELENRVQKLVGWLDQLNEVYESLLSRAAETAGQAGFDPAPRVRPCEHRREWYRGDLCLACDNTGWRPLARGEEGIDPYAGNLPKTTTGVRVDQSAASERGRRLAHIDAQLAALHRDARIRAGMEAQEDYYLRALRIVSRKPKTVKRIEQGLMRLRERYPELYHRLPDDRLALVALALFTPGRIEPVEGPVALALSPKARRVVP